MAFFGWLTIAFILLFLSLIWYYRKYVTLRSTTKSAKGPFPLPFIGSALDVKNSVSIIPWFQQLFKDYGRIVPLMLGPYPIILISDYDAMETILSSNKVLDKSFTYTFMKRWLNNGLLVSTGRKWKTRRRILTPSYHFQILKQFVPIFNNVGDILISQFKNEKNKDAVDVYPYVTLSTLDVICETAMGVSINAQLNRQSPYVHSVKEMGKIFMNRSFSTIEQSELAYKFTSNYKKEMKCLKLLHGHTDSVIKKRREELEQANVEHKTDQDDFGSKKRVAFLDMLLQAKDENGQPLSDSDIREEVDTFMFEGHDTTASGICFALYEIAHNPHVQRKILGEQEKILQGETRDFTYNDLNQMKYLDMVIKESLRLYPSVPVIARETSEEFRFTNDMVAPPNITLSLVIHEIQRDPQYFPEPHKFNPDRFLPQNNLGKRPYSYVPFSAGPRNCIGQKFAILEMKMSLSKMVREFEMLPTIPDHKLILTAETILKSDNGIFIKIKDRHI